jgi:Cu2+-exporting ATPase
MDRADAPLAAAAGGGGVALREPGGRIDPGLVRRIADRTGRLDFIVPDMHCGSCIARIEGALGKLPGVREARANLTARRVAVTFDLALAQPDALLGAITRLGYEARPFDAAALDRESGSSAGGELLRALAVAGFAAGNIMLLSVSVWSGADGATRDLFHWLSALIALPAVAYAGRPFFRSALRAVLGGGLNMDVPIAIGVSLTLAMSLYETATGGAHAYFDAVVTLLFFLLVGRYLDHRMRDVARSAATRLMSLASANAVKIAADGSLVHVPVAQIAVGDRVRVGGGRGAFPG